MSRPSDDVHVLVLGAARLLSHSVERVLEHSGFSLASGDGDGSADKPNVIVLVEPLPSHWRVVEAIDRPAVVLTSLELEPDELGELVVNGADAVLPVECERQHLVDTIGRVVAGESALTRVQSRMLTESVRRRARRESHVDIRLTPRELEILQTIDQGLSVKQTARALGISPRTVENTQRVLYRKLGVRNRAQAIARAYALGVLPGETT